MYGRESTGERWRRKFEWGKKKIRSDIMGYRYGQKVKLGLSSFKKMEKWSKERD